MFKLVPLKRRASVAKSPSTVKNYNSDSEESAVSAKCQQTASVLESQPGNTTAATVTAAATGSESNGSTMLRRASKVKGHALTKSDFGHTVPADSVVVGLDEGYRSAGEMRPHRNSISRAAGTSVVPSASSRGQRSVLRALNSESDSAHRTRQGSGGVLADRYDASKSRGGLHLERQRDGKRPSVDRTKEVEVIGSSIARNVSESTTGCPKKEEHGIRASESGPGPPQNIESFDESHRGASKG